MIQRVEFIIRGHVASDHRRIVSWFDQNKRRRPKPLIFLSGEYKEFRERVRTHISNIVFDKGWQVPEKGVMIKMFIEAHVATHKEIKFKGQGKTRMMKRQVPDEDNIVKCIKDSLQRDRRRKNSTSVDWRYLYLDDKFVRAYPFPDSDWIIIEQGTEEWIRIALECDNVPQAKQSELVLPSSRSTRKSAVAHGSARVEEF